MSMVLMAKTREFRRGCYKIRWHVIRSVRSISSARWQLTYLPSFDFTKRRHFDFALIGREGATWDGSSSLSAGSAGLATSPSRTYRLVRWLGCGFGTELINAAV